MIRNAIIAAAGIAAIAIPANTSSIPESASRGPFLKGVIASAVNTPCEQEDSINCFWDAGNSGNGFGHSFYSIRVGNKMCTVYADRAYNRRNGYCTRIDR